MGKEETLEQERITRDDRTIHDLGQEYASTEGIAQSDYMRQLIEEVAALLWRMSKPAALEFREYHIEGATALPVSGKAALRAVLKNLEKRVRRLEASTRSHEDLEEPQVLTAWPAYPIPESHELVRNAEALRSAVGNAVQVLFHTMELETLLEQAERRARTTDRKYEARLAASLRDLCRVHDPAQFTQEQVDCLKGSMTALVEGWGKLTREKLSYVRTRLLDVGLTWLPVTEKARTDLEQAKGEGLGIQARPDEGPIS